MDINTKNNIIEHAINIRKSILEMGKHAGNHAAHMGAALSIVEILSTLYFGVMNTIEVGMNSSERDRFILSKGHGSLALYAVLIESGIMDKSLMETFEDDYSTLLGHPVKNRDVGIEYTNGSLGMGVGLGVGVGLALKKRNMSNRVYILVGDGECNEGSCWEAFMAAPNYKLDNIVVIIDQNGFQLSGENKAIMDIGDMKEKLSAFGWETISVDGHDIEQLYEALIYRPQKGPLAIICNTVKGKGFTFSENTNTWHHAIVTQKYYDQGMEELKMTSSFYCGW